MIKKDAEKKRQSKETAILILPKKLKKPFLKS
jgi:hypothetical protein